MALTADDFLRQMLALLPPGDAWSRSYSELPASVLDGCAPEFARIQERADALLLEINPATTTELIDQWESAHGLPDACMPELTVLQDRRDALIAHLQESQGHNPADYVAIAVALGHASATCHRRPYLSFRAGVSRAGDRCQGDEWAHVFVLAYMTGLIASPNDFTTWTFFAGTTATAAAARAPDGTLTASELAFLTGSSMYFTLASADTRVCQFSVWVRSDAPTYLGFTGLGLPAGVTVQIDTYWKHITFRGVSVVGDQNVIFTNNTGAPTDVYFWDARAGEVDSAVECKIDNLAQAHSLPLYRVIGGYVPTPG